MIELRTDHFLVRNRFLFVLLTWFMMSPGCCATSWLVSMALPKNRPLVEVLAYLFVAGVFLVLAYVFGVAIWNRFRSGLAAAFLAEKMGLKPLNQSDRPVAIWYGGTIEGHRFGIITYRSYSRYAAEGGSRVRFFSCLRVVLALNRAEPLGVNVQRSTRNTRKAESFEEAFPVQEHADRLGAGARRAMLEFVTKGRHSGWRAILSSGSGMRGLTLRDRAGAPEEWLNPEVFPDAAVILVHDHPDAMRVTPEELEGLLREMVEVVGQAPA